MKLLSDLPKLDLVCMLVIQGVAFNFCSLQQLSQELYRFSWSSNVNLASING